MRAGSYLRVCFYFCHSLNITKVLAWFEYGEVGPHLIDYLSGEHKLLRQNLENDADKDRIFGKNRQNHFPKQQLFK